MQPPFLTEFVHGTVINFIGPRFLASVLDGALV
jgi:hypothetical protein